MNKTKIVATIGPSTSSKKKIKGLIGAGMDVARINLKHSNYDEVREVVKTINDLNEELGTYVAIMFDTQGPEIRTHNFEGGHAVFKRDTKIKIYMEEILGDNTKFSVNYPSLLEDVNYDTIIKIDDGHISMQVLDKGKNYLLCNVLNDGEVNNHRGINVPGVKLNIPFLSERDYKDIEFANELNIDFLALSFVRSYEDILEINDILIKLENDHIGIIAKVECESAIDDLDEIIKVSDGVMVARGDLGVELPLERIPGFQKTIITKCHINGKISIVATEMMNSMMNSAVPTRAEVSDVANAVLDSADAVMLSGETTIGSYPIETVETMNRIVEAAEKDVDYLSFMDRAVRTGANDITGMVAYNVASSSIRLDCSAILAPTISGYTARKISRYRPKCPIIAPTPNISTAKSLQLYYGVIPAMIDELKSFDKLIEQSKKIVSDIIEIKHGDKIIITGGYPFKEVKNTNFMKIEEL